MALCTAGTSGVDHLLNWEFIKAVTCTYAGSAGLLVTGMLVFGAVSSSLYIRTGSLILPFGLALLAGGAMMSVVATPVVALVTIMVLAVGGGVVTYMYHQFTR